MKDKSIFELIAEYSAGTISSADAELLRERLESDAEAMPCRRKKKLTFRSRGNVLTVLWLDDLEKDGGCSGQWVP